MPLVVPEKASHWYTLNGKPFYEVPCKSRPGQMRKATLADARKVGAVPSVTTILRAISKPGLESWKTEQWLLAADDNPRPEGESREQWVVRLKPIAEEVATTTATRGTDLHEVIEAWRLNNEEPDGLPEQKTLAAYKTWHAENVCSMVSTERTFAAFGYGGRIDHIDVLKKGCIAVSDIKTRDTEPGKKVVPYFESGMQLVAYAKGVRYPQARILNLTLSRNEPGRLDIYDWTDQKDRLLRAWNHALGLWCELKNYDPRQTKTGEQT